MGALTTLLAAASAQFSGWRPFHTAMPVWDHWFWLLVPLCAGVAVVYKTTKCRRPSTIPWEAALLTAWIFLGLVAAAAGVAIVVRLN
jgi:hypothetical protein